MLEVEAWELNTLPLSCTCCCCWVLPDTAFRSFLLSCSGSGGVSGLLAWKSYTLSAALLDTLTLPAAVVTVDTAPGEVVVTAPALLSDTLGVSFI